MPSIFTRIINGELPGRFVWRDPVAVAFLSINPLRQGHTLVVPIEEVDHWVALDPAVAQHLMTVAQNVGKAIQTGFQPTRVGLIVVGLEVPHVHLHVSPIDHPHDLDFARATQNPDPASMDEAAEIIRHELAAMGREEVVIA
jgi:histidine triad (HIT) family protein